MTLRNKISKILLVISLLASLFCGILVFTVSRIETGRTASETQLLMTTQALETVDRFLFERHSDIQAAARFQQVENHLNTPDDPRTKEALLKNNDDFLNLYNSWDSLSVIDINGTILSSTYDSIQGQKLTLATREEYDLFQTTLIGNVGFSDFFISDLTGKPTVAFTAPVRASDESGTIIGVMLGHIEWNFITEILYANRTEFHLLDSSGFTIAESDSEHQGSRSNPLALDEKIVRKALEGQTGSEIYTKSRTDPGVLVTYAQEIGYLDYIGNKWILIFERPTEEVFTIFTWTTAMILLIFILGSILLTAGGIYILNRVVVEPIQVLTEVTKKFADGDLTQQAPVTSNDEIGHLASIFNTMASGLRNSHVELENKVVERTNTLADKIAQLDKLNKYMVGREMRMKELKEKLKKIEHGDTPD